MYAETFSTIGTSSLIQERESFGVRLASTTMEDLNEANSHSSPMANEESLDIAVASKSLDYSSSGSLGVYDDGGLSRTYQIAKDMLDAYLAGRGNIIDYQT